MDLRQLEYFEAIARHGGFTRAAEHLHVAQPALSAQIKRLETELGVTLLARTSRRVGLTQAGELLLARTHRILAEVEAARHEVISMSSVLQGRVTLGFTPVVGRFDLPLALSRFHTQYPEVSLSLRSGLVGELLADLDSGAIDLVLGPLHEDLASRFSAQPLVTETLVLITPVGHRPVSALAEVKDEPFACLGPRSGLRSLLENICREAGFQPRVQFETHSPASIRELVAAGLGVALVARSAMKEPGPAVGVHTPTPPLPAHPAIGLVHHRDRRLGPAVLTFRRHLLEYAQV